MKEFTTQNFEEEVLKSDIPVVVDFWATWCQPCLKLGPILEEMEKDYDGEVKFGKLNIENDQEIATKYGVMSIPTILFIKDGEVQQKAVGLRPRKKLEKTLKKVL